MIEIKCQPIFKIRYGKLVGLRLGPYLAICVYDYDIAKEMLAKEEASGKPDVFWNNIRMLDKKLGKKFEPDALIQFERFEIPKNFL